MVEFAEYLMRDLPAALYMCDARGRIIGYNEHAVKLWGRRPAMGEDGESFCGCYKVFTPDGDYISPAHTPMAHALRTGESQFNQRAIVERPDGTRFPALVNISVMHNALGEVVGAVNVFQEDFTSQRIAVPVQSKQSAAL